MMYKYYNLFKSILKSTKVENFKTINNNFQRGQLGKQLKGYFETEMQA